VPTDLIFCIPKVFGKNAYNEAQHQLLMEFKKAYDSLRREVWFKILLCVWYFFENFEANKNVSA
jgi:hypothetical protein